MLAKKNSNKINIRGLIKTSINMEIIKKYYEQVSGKNRNILKQLEEFKFTLEQLKLLFQNNQQLSKNIDVFKTFPSTKWKSELIIVTNKFYEIILTSIDRNTWLVKEGYYI